MSSGPPRVAVGSRSRFEGRQGRARVLTLCEVDVDWWREANDGNEGWMMEYTDLIADFAQRTLHNLDHVQAQARTGDETVYPVTQLWNSLLGLIVLPRERDLGRIPKTPMAELWAAGWPKFTVQGPEPETLHQLVKSLRNAVAHFNVKFEAGLDREIRSVTVWTNSTGREGLGLIRGSRLWEGRFSTGDLDDLARRIADIYLQKFGSKAA